MKGAGVWRGVLALTLLVMVASSCLAMDSKRVLWESRDQFVALESIDAVKGGAKIPNQHPADISRERLLDILGSIQVRLEEQSDPIPLFTERSLEVLAPRLEEAFKEAKPDEDVTFAIIGLHLGRQAIAKVSKATAGRLFYQGGRLNLIVGKAQYEFNERQERRLYPFTPGNREYTAEGDWALFPQPGQSAMTVLRKDWVAFGNDWKPTVAAAPIENKATGAMPGAVSGAQPAQPTALDKLFSGKAGKTAERLGVLKELRDKGVITEEEYRSKRLMILNEL
jgi:hypothetical protein